MRKIKPIYMSCEVQRRELQARLYFAVTAARRGFASVITQKVIMKVNQEALPPGIFWHKTASNRCAHYYEFARKLGNRTVGCCEEILNMPDHLSIDDFFGRFFDKRAAENIDLYLASTTLDSRLAHTLPYGKILNIGNSRVELLRGRNREIFSPYVKKIKKTAGNFILINSSFGITGSFRSVERERQEFGSLSGINTSEKDYFSERLEREKVGIDIVVGLCRMLGAEGKAVVLRPHPHENPEMWRELVADIPKVTVDDRDSATPWLLAADGILQGNCTTGLEAVLLDKPVGNYLADADHTLSSQIIPAHGWQEALEQIKTPPSHEALDAVRASIFGVDNPVVEQTLDAFESLDPPECSLSELLSVGFQSAAQFADASMQRRWPTINVSAAKDFIKSIMQTTGTEGIWFSTPAPNILIVAPTAALPTQA